MKPFGREKKVSGGNQWKIDYHKHPKHIWQNWWESICDYIPRSTQKANMRKEIDNQIIDDM